MATITPTVEGRFHTDSFPGETAVHTWSGLSAVDTAGEAVGYGAHADRSVQVMGTFGAGGAVTLQGSNDGSSWYTLTDFQGNALVITVAGIYTVSEATRFIRPSITGSDGTTNLDVVMFSRGL